MLDNVPCAILTSHMDGTINTANEIVFDWTSLSHSSIIGKTKFQDLLTMPGRLFCETHFRPQLHTAGELGLTRLARISGFHRQSRCPIGF